jgi:hypothetical protein
MRRRLLELGVGVVLVVALAGCGGGSGPSAEDRPLLTGTADAAELDAAVRAETGFVEAGRHRGAVNTTISATIQGDVELRTTRRVDVTTVSVSYRRERAAFGTYSVPGVRPFERADLTKNPVEGTPPAALATRAQRAYAVDELTAQGSATVTLLGEETTATRYAGTATPDGEEVRVGVVVTTVRHDGDYVSAVVVAPSEEPVPLAALFGGVTH